jgi:hypothetical protein
MKNQKVCGAPDKDKPFHLSSERSCPDNCTKELSSVFKEEKYYIEKSTGKFIINSTIDAYKVCKRLLQEKKPDRRI